MFAMEKPRTHGLALFLASFPLVGSAFIALFGLVWGLGLKCDENCTGEDWQHTAGAPQWTVLTVAGLVVFAAGIALFVFVYRAQPWPALAALGFGTVTLVGTLSWWGTNWSKELPRHPLSFGALACILLSGALASFLCVPATGRQSEATR
jgi:hypothetical protein